MLMKICKGRLKDLKWTFGKDSSHGWTVSSVIGQYNYCCGWQRSLLCGRSYSANLVMQVIPVQVLTPGVGNLLIFFGCEGARVHFQQVAALRAVPLLHILIHRFCPAEEGGTRIKHTAPWTPSSPQFSPVKTPPTHQYLLHNTIMEH